MDEIPESLVDHVQIYKLLTNALWRDEWRAASFSVFLINTSTKWPPYLQIVMECKELSASIECRAETVPRYYSGDP